ncbi:hypothetical protein R1A27_25215 [Methylobacterium sp. NMS12]|uniref:hypothetical protein n=1 Tax=Methylobacterium sp. NMS12 TaxID=3079766 RepID=UPI003F882D35
MVYVLIIMLAGSGSAIGSVEFNTQQACPSRREADRRGGTALWRGLPGDRVRAEGVRRTRPPSLGMDHI